MILTTHPALYGVVGDPIGHSLSPLIHGGWISDHGFDASYLAYRFPETNTTLNFSGLYDLGFQGLNVTLPHKITALAEANIATSRAKEIGAANTLIRTEKGWLADNTDAYGFSIGLERCLVSKPLDTSKVLVLGAGGAARAVLYELKQKGIEDFTLGNRTLRRAEEVLQHFALPGVTIISLTDALAHLDQFDLVINATSLGHGSGSIDWVPTEDGAVYDLSYGRQAEAVLNPARTAGWQTEDGLSMLVGQAAAAFQLWFGISPDLELGLTRCREMMSSC